MTFTHRPRKYGTQATNARPSWPATPYFGADANTAISKRFSCQFLRRLITVMRAVTRPTAQRMLHAVASLADVDFSVVRSGHLRCRGSP